MEPQLLFSCNFCDSSGQQLTDMEQLEHIRMEHLDYYKPYKCIQCHRTYAVEPTFRDHALIEHNSDSIADSSNSSQFLNVLGDMMMQCSFYNAIGKQQTATRLINAVKHATIGPTVPCKPEIQTTSNSKQDDKVQRNATFTKLYVLRQSEAKKKKKTDLACEFCPKQFSRPSALKYHQDSGHNRISNGANKCKKCDRRYHYPSMLRAHLKWVHKICMPEKKAPTKTISTKLGRPKGTGKTEVCKKRDSKSKTKCTFCPMTFDKICNWRLHQDNKHNRVSNGPYKCSVCDKRYYNYSNYKRCHYESDSLKIPQTLSCKFCSLKCKNADQLQKHQDTEHAQPRNVSILRKSVLGLSKKKKPITKFGTSKDRYWCLRCQNSFNSIGQHIAICHIKKRVVDCSECDYKHFWNICNVRKHIATVHKGKGRVIDRRVSIAGEIQRLAKEILRRNADAGKPIMGSMMSVQTHFLTGNLTLFRRKPTVEREKWAHCRECNYRLSIDSVRDHLAARHIRKHCIKCNGCQFSTHWYVQTMKVHIDKHHKGRNVGFVDKRHEIKDEIKEMIKQCITFGQMSRF